MNEEAFWLFPFSFSSTSPTKPFNISFASVVSMYLTVKGDDIFIWELGGFSGEHVSGIVCASSCSANHQPIYQARRTLCRQHKNLLTKLCTKLPYRSVVLMSWF